MHRAAAQRRSAGIAAVFGFLALIAPGCDLFSRDPAPAPKIIEIGGITIAVNAVGQSWEEDTGWSYTERWRAPSGTMDPGSISDLAVHPDGSVVVLDQLARKALILDPTGAATLRIGGAGIDPSTGDPDADPPVELDGIESVPFDFGPGISHLFIDSDGVLNVPDAQRGQIHRFSIAGEILEARPFPDVPGAALAWAAGSSGQVYAHWFTGAGDVLLRSDGQMADDGSTEPMDTLLFLLPPIVSGADGRIPWNPIPTAPLWAPLADGRVAFARTIEYRIQFVSPDGDANHALTGPPGRDSVDADVLDSLWTERAILRGVPRDLVPDLVPREQWAVPNFMPPLTSLIEGPEASLWVRRSPRLEDADPRGLGGNSYESLGGEEWDVFDASGLYLGSIHLPGSLRMPAFQGDHLFGVLRGESGQDVIVSLGLAGFPGTGTH